MSPSEITQEPSAHVGPHSLSGPGGVPSWDRSRSAQRLLCPQSITSQMSFGMFCSPKAPWMCSALIYSLNFNALLYSAFIALLLQMFMKSSIPIFQMGILSSLRFCESAGAHLSWIPDTHHINSHSWEQWLHTPYECENGKRVTFCCIHPPSVTKQHPIA